MDNNDNQAIIYKLAKRSQKNNRIRNFFICFTIVLSTTLIFAFMLYIFGTQEEKLRILENSAQLSYKDITLSQANILQQDIRIQWMGLEAYVGRKKVGDTRLSVTWQDDKFMEKDQITYTGNLPTGDLEIMISQEYLEKLGMGKLQLGDTISLNLGDDIFRDYQISAISTNPSKAKNSQHIYVSLSCAMMLNGIKGEEKVDVSINMKNALDMSIDEAEKQAKRIAAKAGITEEQTELSYSFFMSTNLSRLTTEDIIALILVILLILIAAGVVIYNIFCISITGKVREYGQMRTIGMTKKQVKSLILQEGFYLALKGGLIGLLFGGLMGYALVPNGFDIMNFFVAAVISIVLSILFVGISVRKPGKLAAAVSPIEALGYIGYTGKGQKNRKYKHSLTPKYLAVLNLKRNKRKSSWTLCSLILAGILLGTIASYVISYDPAGSVEISFPEGEYQLQLSQSSGFGNDMSLDGQMKGLSLLQSENIMGEELQTEIENIEGVIKAKPWRYLYISTTLFGEEPYPIGLNGISEDDFKRLKEMSYEGVDSYEEFSKQPGLIIDNHFLKPLKEHPLSIGDKVPIIFYDKNGERRETVLPVVGVVKVSFSRTEKVPLSIMGSSFMMPNLTMDQWAGMSTIYGYEIATEQKKSKAVGTVLEELYSLEEELFLSSKAERREFYENSYFSTKVILYVLVIFIVVFGIINLTNTMITNLYSRKKELGILQAIGMTKEQLKVMLSKETLNYIIISAGCTLIFGSALGYALVMAQIQMGYSVIYSYPWIPILLYILAMFLVQQGLTSYGVKLLQKESLVERMKNIE